jgi:putative Mg2+ transporter-C (MgtC) family protein
MLATEIVLRLATATATGAVLGLNRKLRGKPAGLRTHALVSLGAALGVLTAELVVGGAAGADRGAITRAIQGIIAGVGFLGGGAILKSGTDAVRGLTTAASIWLAACVGVACGAGFWLPAVVAIGLALMVLIVGGPLERAVRRMSNGRPEEGKPEPRKPDGAAERKTLD